MTSSSSEAVRECCMLCVRPVESAPCDQLHLLLRGALGLTKDRSRSVCANRALINARHANTWLPSASFQNNGSAGRCPAVRVLVGIVVRMAPLPSRPFGRTMRRAHASTRLFLR